MLAALPSHMTLKLTLVLLLILVVVDALASKPLHKWNPM
jgi:hypothetical protein